jgi:hypothetical protein
MRIFDKDGKELQESELDLSLGYLTKGTVIKEGAAPIDDVTKFAWDDDDYEEVRFYHPYSDEPEPAPTQEERITELEKALAMLLSGVTE